ncbi:MAG: YitT family protein [Cytophagaceae bacterium]
MKGLFNKIIVHALVKPKNRISTKIESYSWYEEAKLFYTFRIALRQLIIDTILISLGVLSAAFGLKSFLIPNQFIDGGATGISLLISELTPVSLPVMIIIVNIPFIIMGWKSIGKEFAIKTGIAIIALSAAVTFIPYQEITHDKLLVAVFGGFFLGAGIGLSVRGGAVIDGTEVLAIAISKKLGITIGDFILIFNIILFSVAAYFLTLETALYSILTYLAASKTLDFIIEGIEEYTGVTVISAKVEEIRQMITMEMGRGVTLYKGERGFGKRGETGDDVKIIFTVITRLEVSRLNEEIERIDPNAFIVMHSIKDTKGGMIKKRRLKH